MDFRTLTYFRVVAQELNFTHAAEKLNMSQPPLSNQIKNLEDDLGVQLFIRGKRKMKLTEAGHLLYRRSGQLLGLADKTRKEISAMEQGLSVPSASAWWRAARPLSPPAISPASAPSTPWSPSA